MRRGSVRVVELLGLYHFISILSSLVTAVSFISSNTLSLPTTIPHMHIRVQASQRARPVRERSRGPEAKAGRTHRRERRGMGHQARGALFLFGLLPEIWVSSRISVVVPGPYFMGVPLRNNSGHLAVSPSRPCLCDLSCFSIVALARVNISCIISASQYQTSGNWHGVELGTPSHCLVFWLLPFTAFYLHGPRVGAPLHGNGWPVLFLMACFPTSCTVAFNRS